MSITRMILAASQWTAINHMNPHLEFSAKVLMAWDHVSDADKDKLRDFWRNEYRDKTEIDRGLFKRFPLGTSEYRDGYSTSHDELITGICFMSWLLDDGETARRILDEGRTIGFYFSGKSPPKYGHGDDFKTKVGNFLMRYVDSEWLVLFNPVYRGYAKLAAGRRLSFLEGESIKLDLLLTKTANLIDIRCLFLERLGLFGEHTRRARRRIGNSYRGRYGDDPIYLKIWGMRDEREYN